MLVSPDSKVDPLGNIGGPETIRNRNTWFEIFFEAILMQNKNGDIIFNISNWFLKYGFILFEKIV